MVAVAGANSVDPDVTDEFEQWYIGLSNDDTDKVDIAVEALENGGPSLGRPFVDRVHSSRHANMKELIPRSSHIRILFAFAPTRIPILLLGGDKTGLWNEWYRINVPIADTLYDRHLAQLQKGQ